MAIFDSGLSNISILIDVPFPSNVVSGPGVRLDKTNSVWSVGLDVLDLVENTNPGALSSYYLPWWDAGLGQYEKVRADHLVAATTGADQRTPVGDANYSVLTTDRYIGLTTTLTAVRTLTLPAAATVPGGRVVTIQDEAGAISPGAYERIVPTGTDTIDGASQWLLKTRYGAVSFIANNANAWSVRMEGQRSPVSDASYTVTQGDIVVAYTAITAARTVTLPAAAAYPQGLRLLIVDESGSCSATSTIGITRTGSDTIDGTTSATIAQAYGYLALVGDGASRWTIVDSSAVPSAQISDASATGRSLITGTVAQDRVTLGIDARTVVGDTNYTVLATDRYVVSSAALTAPRIWTLPPASALSPGQEIVFEDAGRATTTVNTITITRAGSDTIDQTGTSAALGARVQQGVRLRSDGISNWSYPSLYGNLDGFAVGSSTPSSGAFTTLSASSGTFTTLGASGTSTLGEVHASGIDNSPIGATTPASGAFTTLAVASTTTLTGADTFNTAPASFLNQGRLSLVSATSLKFVPYNGAMLKIAGNAYLIPSGGIAGLGNTASCFKNGTASSALAASTFYYVYAFLNGSTVTADFWDVASGGAHATSATAGNVGTEIRSGDDTRTLIGAVYTDASAHLNDSDANRTVLSWFNRQPKRLQNAFTATRTTTSTTFAEINSEIRCTFITWADDPPSIGFTGQFFMTGGAAGVIAGIGLDNGTATITPTSACASSTVSGGGIGLTEVTGISEGASHFFTMAGVAGTSTTGSWQKATSVTGEQFGTLTGTLRG